jgi:hypothetical protein
MENLKLLSKDELLDIDGGGWLQELAFAAGYQAGKTLDLIHGIYDGLTGQEAH